MTPEVFNTFQHVIQHTVMPSWMGSVLHNFRVAAAGTPKADEWWTIFTIYLPITLILLFDHWSLDDAWRKKVLDHTMQLVCAVLLTCKHMTTQHHVHRYWEYLQNYISQLPVLYPDLSCESIYHIAFYIYDFLKLFGPVHLWWTFPFEQLIGQLQCLLMNHKFGLYHLSMVDAAQY